MKMHTEEQCKVKVQGIKTLATRLQLEIKEKGSATHTAESILAMCDELIREFKEK
jgi:hypothetical protein